MEQAKSLQKQQEQQLADAVGQLATCQDQVSALERGLKTAENLQETMNVQMQEATRRMQSQQVRALLY